MAQTAQTDVILPTEPARELPVVRSIGVADLRDALAKGVDDFRAMPTHVHVPQPDLSADRPRAFRRDLRLRSSSRCSFRWRPALR